RLRRRPHRVLPGRHPSPGHLADHRPAAGGQRHRRRRVPDHRRRAPRGRTRRLRRPTAGRPRAADPDHAAARRVRRHQPRRTTGAARLMTPAILVYLPLAAPVAAAALAAALPRRVAAWIGVLAAAVILGTGVALATTELPVAAAGGWLRADALTAVMLLVIGVVATVACWAGVAHLDAEATAGATTPATAR